MPEKTKCRIIILQLLLSTFGYAQIPKDTTQTNPPKCFGLGIQTSTTPSPLKGHHWDLSIHQEILGPHKNGIKFSFGYAKRKEIIDDYRQTSVFNNRSVRWLEDSTYTSFEYKSLETKKIQMGLQYLRQFVDNHNIRFDIGLGVLLRNTLFTKYEDENYFFVQSQGQYLMTDRTRSQQITDFYGGNRIYTEASMHMLFAFMIKMKGFGLKAQYRLDYNYDTVALETQPWTLNFALGLYKLWYKKPEKDKKARSA